MKKEDPDRILRDIGCRIAELRAERKWTQQQLAERLGVSVRYLARLERGKQNLTVERLVWLAGHLGVRTIDLFLPSREQSRPDGAPTFTGTQLTRLGLRSASVLRVLVAAETGDLVGDLPA